MILMAIQLFPPSTNKVNSLGARGKKSRGRRQPSSQTTLITAAVTLESSSVSINMSLIFGHAGLSVSGCTKARRYSATVVFLRMLGLECDKRGIKSVSNDSARDEVITCGRVISGSEMVGIEEEEMS